MVFEQNEILGLRAIGTETWILSCRVVDEEAREGTHAFARPLLAVTCYQSYADAARGLGRALLHRRGTLLRALSYVARSAQNPLMLPKVVGALVLALGWYHRFDDGRQYHVHADFGQNSATAALFLSMLLRSRFSFKVHAFDIYSTLLRHRDPLRSIKARHAAVIVSEHDYGRHVLESTLPAVIDKIFVNYSSVRTEEFRPLPARPGSRRFVALGRLVPKKGFGVLVEAASRLRDDCPDIVVDIYGEGPDEARLRLLIARYRLEDVVRLRGAYDNGELPTILEECISLVVPSIVAPTGDMDGVPTVIYEAMALNRPVIASALSGIPEIVRHGETGMLFTAGDQAELVRCMRTLLDNPAMAESLGAAGRQLMEERHDCRVVAQDLLDGLGLGADDVPAMAARA